MAAPDVLECGPEKERWYNNASTVDARKRREKWPLWLLVGAVGCQREGEPAARPRRCGDAPSEARGSIRALPAQAYDLVVTRAGTYVVGTARGVMELDPCSLTRRAGCDDTGGAHRVSPREGSRVVDYLRDDGTASACDLARGERVAPDGDANARLHAPYGAQSHGHSAWIEGSVAWLRPGGQVARRLALSDEALGVAFGADGRSLAVSDRAGTVVFFTVPEGAVYAREAVHVRNVYRVALDAERGRAVSVSGPGRIAVRTWPARPSR